MPDDRQAQETHRLNLARRQSERIQAEQAAAHDRARLHAHYAQQRAARQAG